MKYINCRISIRDSKNIEYEDEYYRKAKGEIQIDNLTRRTIERLNYWVANYGKTCNRKDLEILGEHLYNLLFNTADPGSKTTIKKEFETTYSYFEKEKQRDPDQRLRLVLIFYPASGELLSYPWEFLFMPRANEGFFLAGKKTELILTRFVPETGIQHRVRGDGPLRILIAFCHPREEGSIEAEDIINEIVNLRSDHLEIKKLNNPPFTQLKEEINTFKPDILHFIGHGRPGEIAFIKEADELKEEVDLKGKEKAEEATWIDSKTVIELFTEHQPHFVFLHACKGAVAESLDSFKSTARELVYSKVPVVVAMQYEISNEDALIFAKKFYQQIGEGKHIDEAVSEARYQLGTFPPNRRAWNDRSFGTPIVYLQEQSEIPIITPRKKTAQDQPDTSTSTVSADTIRCPYHYLPQHCSGWVPKKLTPLSKVCTTCGCEIMECPKCHNIMAKERGICGCGYKLRSTSVSAETEDVQHEFEPLTDSGQDIQVPEQKTFSTALNPKSAMIPRLCCWDEVPGNDSGRLVEFLKQEFGISWAETAIIEKIDDGRTIRVTNEKNYLSLEINNEKTKVNLKINDVRSAEFSVKTESSKLNVYRSMVYANL